jgi:hypothetical protein
MHCSRDTPVGYGRSRPIAVGQSAQFGGVAVRVEVRPNFSRGHSGQLWGGPPGREDVPWHCSIRSGKHLHAVVFSELPLENVYRFGGPSPRRICSKQFSTLDTAAGSIYRTSAGLPGSVRRDRTSGFARSYNYGRHVFRGRAIGIVSDVSASIVNRTCRLSIARSLCNFVGIK